MLCSCGIRREHQNGQFESYLHHLRILILIWNYIERTSVVWNKPSKYYQISWVGEFFENLKLAQKFWIRSFIADTIESNFSIEMSITDTKIRNSLSKISLLTPEIRNSLHKVPLLTAHNLISAVWQHRHWYRFQH